MSEVNKYVQELGVAFESFKSTNEQRLAEIEKHGDALSDTKEKLARIESDLDQIGEMKSRLDRLAAADTQGKDAENVGVCQRHVEAFEAWVRNPSDAETRAAAKAAQREAMDARPEYAKEISTGAGASGGFAVPEVLLGQIERQVREISPMRSEVRVVTAGSPDFRALVNRNGSNSGWVGETGARTGTNTPQLQEVKPDFGTLYAYVGATEESLDDVFFDVSGFLVEAISEEFAHAEGQVIFNGDGIDKPTGLLANLAATDDAARAAGTVQFFATGSAGFDAAVPGDILLDAVYGLKGQHRANAKWAMNRNTLGLVRKFKDSDNNYLWTPGLQAGQPDSLLGYPVIEAEALADVADGADPIVIADWSRAYLLVDLVGMRMTVDDNITEPGRVKWYVRRRMGGAVYNDQAAKVIRNSV